MSFAELIGFLASGFILAAFYMNTMIPLRMLGVCANAAFIAYGYLESLYPVLALHLILLPLNGFRLYEMLQLTRQVRTAADGGLDLDWIKSYGATKHVPAGTVLFKKGEPAGALYVVVSGRFRLAETDWEIAPPQLVGELGFLVPGRERTQTVQCTEDATLLEIGYGQLEQLFFQNPKFGFFFLRLIAHRLFQNIERLETERAQYRKMAPG